MKSKSFKNQFIALSFSVTQEGSFVRCCRPTAGARTSHQRSILVKREPSPGASGRRTVHSVPTTTLCTKQVTGEQEMRWEVGKWNGRSPEAGNHVIRSLLPTPSSASQDGIWWMDWRFYESSLCVSDRCWWYRLEQEHQRWRGWCLPKPSALTSSDWRGKKPCTKLLHQVKLGKPWEGAL